jgi:hypothetical protein
MTINEQYLYIVDFLKYLTGKNITKIHAIKKACEEFDIINEKSFYYVIFDDDVELEHLRYYYIDDMIVWLRKIKLEKILKNINK